MAPAQTVFKGVEFKEIFVDDKIVGYRATFNGVEFESQSLTNLCEKIWCKVAGIVE